MSEIKRPSETFEQYLVERGHGSWLDYAHEWRDYALQIERLAGELSDALEHYIGMADEAALDVLYDEVVCRHTVLRVALEREQMDEAHVFAEFTPMTDNGFTKIIPNVRNPELGSIPTPEPDDRQQDTPQGPFANTKRPPADRETSRIPRLMICKHSPSEIVSGDEGTSYCGACQREQEAAQGLEPAPKLEGSQFINGPFASSAPGPEAERPPLEQWANLLVLEGFDVLGIIHDTSQYGLKLEQRIAALEAELTALRAAGTFFNGMSLADWIGQEAGLPGILDSQRKRGWEECVEFLQRKAFEVKALQPPAAKAANPPETIECCDRCAGTNRSRPGLLYANYKEFRCPDPWHNAKPTAAPEGGSRGV